MCTFDLYTAVYLLYYNKRQLNRTEIHDMRDVMTNIICVAMCTFDLYTAVYLLYYNKRQLNGTEIHDMRDVIIVT